MTQEFSVLMSIYIKERPEYVKDCFDSLLRQTIKASEWIVVEDGALTDDMYKLLEIYQEKNPNLIKRIKIETNVGLGLALREGIKYCSNELIARMDTDDISREDRFELQLNEFLKNQSLDICGSHIIEFDNNVENVLSRRKVPLSDESIKKYQRKRSAFNHMTVMYKKEAVLQAGNYEHCPLMEDDMLWIKMMLAGATCMNIDDYLVFARTGNDMIQRRGGYKYFQKYKSAKKKIYSLNYISFYNYILTVSIQLLVSLLPNKLRYLVFCHFLR